MIDMCHSIAIAGANGSGKTTLGSHLANLLGYKHMDAEDYCFEESEVPYTKPRAKEKVQDLLLDDINRQGQFIITAVNCDFGKAINAMYDYVIYLKVPLKVRLERLKQRSVNKFGSRVLKGGDMYVKEQEFYNFAAFRTMDKTDAWLKSIKCPIICVDGTKTIVHITKLIKERITEVTLEF